MFRRKEPDVEGCITRINGLVEEVSKVKGNEVRKENIRQRPTEVWKPLASGWVKINCDGAFLMKNSGKWVENAGIGVVIRDEEGKVIAGESRRILVKSGEEAEAEAVKEGMILVERCGMKKVIVETDSEIVYKEIKGVADKGNWRIYPYVKDIQGRRNRFEGFECVWSSRKANQTVDWVAKQVRKGMCVLNWVSLPHHLLYIY